MKKKIIRLIVVYSLLAFSANIVCAKTIFSNQEVEKFKKGEMKKLILASKNIEHQIFTVYDMENNEININLNDGRIKIVNFWALWCAPCKREMKSLNNIKSLFYKKNLDVITIASGRNSIKKITGFFLENNLEHIINYRDPFGELSSSLTVVGLPTTLIIDPEGIEVGRIIGDINWSSKESVDLFEFLLSKN